VKKTTILRVRLSPIDRNNLDQLARSTGRTYSQVIRDVIDFLVNLPGLTPLDTSLIDRKAEPAED
jgi:hypothetical protein